MAADRTRVEPGPRGSRATGRRAPAGVSCPPCPHRSWAARRGTRRAPDPPAGDAWTEEGCDLGRAHGGPWLQHDVSQRTLTPALIRPGHDRRFPDGGVGHELALQLHRADPFAARLHEVLGAIDDLDDPVRGDAGDVAGAQPAIVEVARVGVIVRIEVGRRDPPDHGPPAPRSRRRPREARRRPRTRGAAPRPRRAVPGERRR